MYKIIVLLTILYCFTFIGCKDKSVNPEEEGPIIATGTYRQDSVDKDIWGDFQLVLELNKPRYKYGESIFTKLYFENIGKTTITFDSIGGITTWKGRELDIYINHSNELIKFNIHREYNIINKIEIEPGNSLKLIQADLTEIRGQFKYKEDSDLQGEWYSEIIDNVYSKFEKGTYKISGEFWAPKPSIYYTRTDTLTFEIY